MLTPNKRQAGVTMIELMIGIALLGVLIGMGVPTFRSWLQNSQIRTAADRVINGVQLARSEAIRRNKPVEFDLRTGANWSVVLVSPAYDLARGKGELRHQERGGHHLACRRRPYHLQPDWRALRQQPGRLVPDPADRHHQLAERERVAPAADRDLGVGQRTDVRPGFEAPGGRPAPLHLLR